MFFGVPLRWRQPFGARPALLNSGDALSALFCGKLSNLPIDDEDFGQRGADDLMAAVVTAFGASNVSLRRSEDASEVSRQRVFNLRGEGL